MLKTRVIPCLLLNKNGGLVKTKKFKNPVYVGDPINAVKIFNDKEVDELVVLDIEASKNGYEPNFNLLSKITKEAFMPMAYGGGINKIEHIKKLFYLGFEKVVLNTIVINNPGFIKEAASISGSQSIVVCIDLKKDFFGKYKVYSHAVSKIIKKDPVDFAQEIEDLGAGEIILNNVDRDGTFLGYDIELIKRITDKLNIPVVALGGAGKLEDFVDVVKNAGASAVSAGSMFVFHGKHKAVLITYPNKKELENIL